MIPPVLSHTRCYKKLRFINIVTGIFLFFDLTFKITDVSIDVKFKYWLYSAYVYLILFGVYLRWTKNQHQGNIAIVSIVYSGLSAMGKIISIFGYGFQYYFKLKGDKYMIILGLFQFFTFYDFFALFVIYLARNSGPDELSDEEERESLNSEELEIEIVDFEEELKIQSCCICLDDYDGEEPIIRTKCNHLYHKKCIKEWLNKKCICPLCAVELHINN